MAELFDLINTVYTTDTVVRNRLSRTEILDVLAEHAIPSFNENQIFCIRSKLRLFVIYYNRTEDEYYFEKMNLAE